MTKIAIFNGPNLNLLGKRQPEIYGQETLADVDARCRTLAGDFRYDIDVQQSNAEHRIVGALQAARETIAGIVINPAAHALTSMAMMDALRTFEEPIVKVQISNVHQREDFRRHFDMSPVATAVMAGCGTHGDRLALRHMADLLRGPSR